MSAAKVALAAQPTYFLVVIVAQEVPRPVARPLAMDEIFEIAEGLVRKAPNDYRPTTIIGRTKIVPAQYWQVNLKRTRLILGTTCNVVM